jgi:hypothetical protein
MSRTALEAGNAETRHRRRNMLVNTCGSALGLLGVILSVEPSQGYLLPQQRPVYVPPRPVYVAPRVNTAPRVTTVNPPNPNIHRPTGTPNSHVYQQSYARHTNPYQSSTENRAETNIGRRPAGVSQSLSSNHKGFAGATQQIRPPSSESWSNDSSHVSLSYKNANQPGVLTPSSSYLDAETMKILLGERGHMPPNSSSALVDGKIPIHNHGPTTANAAEGARSSSKQPRVSSTDKSSPAVSTPPGASEQAKTKSKAVRADECDDDSTCEQANDGATQDGSGAASIPSGDSLPNNQNNALSVSNQNDSDSPGPSVAPQQTEPQTLQPQPPSGGVLSQSNPNNNITQQSQVQSVGVLSQGNLSATPERNPYSFDDLMQSNVQVNIGSSSGIGPKVFNVFGTPQYGFSVSNPGGGPYVGADVVYGANGSAVVSPSVGIAAPFGLAAVGAGGTWTSDQVGLSASVRAGGFEVSSSYSANPSSVYQRLEQSIITWMSRGY